MLKVYFLLTILAFGLCGYATTRAAAKEEVLFERKMTIEEAKHFTVLTTTATKETWRIKEWSPEKIKGIKEYYIRFATYNPAILRIVYVEDDITGEPIAVRTTWRNVKTAAVIYQREISEEDLDRYKLESGTWSPAPPDDATLEEINQQFPKEYWDQHWGIQKVEVKYCGAMKGQFDKDPQLFVYKLVGSPKKTSEQKQKENEWTDWAEKNLKIGKDVNGFTHLETEYEFPVPEDHTYDLLTPFATIREIFSYPNKLCDVGASISQYPCESIPSHEVIRQLIPRIKNSSFIETDFGTVIASYSQPLAYDLRLPGPSPCIIWTSGNLFIRVGAPAGDIKELLKLYGNRFQSDLPKRYDISIMQWVKDEVELILLRLKANIPGEKPVRINWFTRNYRKLTDMLALPEDFPQYDSIRLQTTSGNKTLPFLPSEEYKKKLYDKLFLWWERNKENLEYDPKIGKFAAKEKD